MMRFLGAVTIRVPNASADVGVEFASSVLRYNPGRKLDHRHTLRIRVFALARLLFHQGTERILQGVTASDMFRGPWIKVDPSRIESIQHFDAGSRPVRGCSLLLE